LPAMNASPTHSTQTGLTKKGKHMKEYTAKAYRLPEEAVKVGSTLRDTQTGITYKVNEIVRPLGGNLAWINAADRHGNQIQIQAEDIGSRYVSKGKEPVTPEPPATGAGTSAAHEMEKRLNHRAALHLIQHAADAFVTWEQCAGRSKADACWNAFDYATSQLEHLGGTMPNRETLRLIGRYNGDGEI